MIECHNKCQILWGSFYRENRHKDSNGLENSTLRGTLRIKHLEIPGLLAIIVVPEVQS